MSLNPAHWSFNRAQGRENNHDFFSVLIKDDCAFKSVCSGQNDFVSIKQTKTRCPNCQKNVLQVPVTASYL